MKIFALLLFLAFTASCENALAADTKPDGKWRGTGGAALSISSGNTSSSSLNLTADAARVTPDDKLSFNAQILGSRSESNGVTSTSANQWGFGSRYEHDISVRVFGFAGLDLSRDQIKLLALRGVVSGGLGYHLVKTPETQWNLVGGANYRADRYSETGVLVNGQMRTHSKTAELLLGEDSIHKLGESTSFKQRLMVNPSLSSDKGVRVAFDTSLLVAMNKTLSLSVALQDRYDSHAQAPIKKTDTLFFTGINVKFGE